ncbi:MAG: aldose epimerase family protein [Thalassotalea sp.]
MSDINVITLNNDSGMEVDILNLGARVSSIKFPVNGKLKEMTATYQAVEDFKTDQFYIGATAGRYANRIAKGQFSLGDETFQLTTNNGENCLHGGVEGFSHRYWQVEAQNKQSVVLVLISPDGDQGFPGEMTTKVKYTLTADNSLDIEFSATSTKDTTVNLCNHCYFNLGEPDINTLSLMIKSEHILPVNENSIPTGELRAITNTDFDFSEAVALSKRLPNISDKMLSVATGFDHCYTINGDISEVVAELSSKQVSMTIKTDQPGLQFYTAAYLSGAFKPFEALCLEAQNYPDAINQPKFPSALLKAGDSYHKMVSYIFSEK